MKIEKLEEIRAKAKEGDAEAQLKLGWMYYYGNFVSQNDQEAAKWTRKAAELGNGYRFVKSEPKYEEIVEDGNPETHFKLGLVYENGIGVVQDFQEAAKWFLKSAKKGHRCAQDKIGCMYLHGQGVLKDEETAKYWLDKSGTTEYWLGKDGLKNPVINIE